jgi:glycosyltransferase involved in cell wall biosynthesis
MSRIVIDAREYGTSTGRYIEKLLQYLQTIDQAHEYKVLVKAGVDFQPVNSKFEKIVCPYREFTFGEQLGFSRQLYGLKADLVHFGMVQQPLLYRNKSVTTIHDLTTARFRNPAKNRLVFTVKQQVYRYVIKRAARRAVVVLTAAEYVKQDIVQFTGINLSKITVTYEAADPITDRPQPIAGLQGKQFVMYVGRPTPHKNLKRLIEAFVLLKAQHPDLLLVLAGKLDTNYRRLEKSVRKRNLKGMVFTGFVSEAELRWLYENCTAYVFPSLSEGFGLPGLEAMVHGAPVVSSNATCLPEIYGEAAHYFDPLDVRAMSDAINEVLTDQDLRADLIQKGRQQAGKYSWQRMAEQTLEVYNRALKA